MYYFFRIKYKLFNFIRVNFIFAISKIALFSYNNELQKNEE
jgi:hypothetical protein